MSRVELCDAIELLNEWLPKHNYRAELKALREDLRKAGRQIDHARRIQAHSATGSPENRIRAAYDRR